MNRGNKTRRDEISIKKRCLNERTKRKALIRKHVKSIVKTFNLKKVKKENGHSQDQIAFRPRPHQGINFL